MNQEIKPSALMATPPGEGELSLSPIGVGEPRPMLLRRDLVAMLPYLNRTEFCRRSSWDQAREVGCGIRQAATASRRK